MARFLPALLLTLASACLLSAAPKPEVVRPDWLEKPSGDAVNRAYPDAALRREESGRVVLGCTVTTDGLVVDCEVVSEDPPGFGFGRAALTLTDQMRMRPMTVGGVPRDSSVRIPLAFSSGKGSGGKRIDWTHRVACVGEVMDSAQQRAIGWPPGEETDWYGLYVTAGLRERTLSAEALLRGLATRLEQAGDQTPAVRASSLTFCHQLLVEQR